MADEAGSRSSNAPCPRIYRGAHRPVSMSPCMRKWVRGSVRRPDDALRISHDSVRFVRDLDPLPQDRCRVLRHDGIDVEAGAALEPRGLRETRGDLEMPVVLRFLPIAVAISCGCGWERDGPARSPGFLKIRMYLNRLSRIRSRYRCLYAVMISCTWNSLCMERWCSCSGVSTMISCAPTPFTLWNNWLTRRWTSPSTCNAGYLFGTQRIHHPGPLGTPSFR